MPYRVVTCSGVPKVETYADLLPHNAVICMREAGGGVDSQNFALWAAHFINSVQHLTINQRKILLILDGYRSHMSLHVLEILNDNNIIVYALPAHTSGKLSLWMIQYFRRSKPR